MYHFIILFKLHKIIISGHERLMFNVCYTTLNLYAQIIKLESYIK